MQAAVGEAISRIDAATKTIEREYRVREEQRELLQTLKNEKSLIKEASQNQKLLEQELNALKVRSKLKNENVVIVSLYKL